MIVLMSFPGTSHHLDRDWQSMLGRIKSIVVTLRYVHPAAFFLASHASH